MKLAVDILNSAIKSYEYSIKGLDNTISFNQNACENLLQEKAVLEQKVIECKQALELLEGKSV